MRSRFVSPVALLILLAAKAEAQEAPPVTTTLADRVRLDWLVHLQTASSSVDSVLGVDGELRRIRVALYGTATETVSAAIQADFDSDRARIRDAYVEWKATPALAIRAGQFKVPINGIELESAKRLLVIERATRIRGLGGSTSTSVARLSFDLIEGEDRRPLVAAVAAVTNGFFGGPRDTLATVADTTVVVRDTKYAKAFEGWIEYGSYRKPGPHVALSVIGGDNPARPRLEGDGIEFPFFLGTHGWGEYVLSIGAALLTDVGVVLRIDRFDPDTDTDDDANVLLTPGVNLYFGEKVKLQINQEWLVPEADDAESESAFRAQLQVLL